MDTLLNLTLHYFDFFVRLLYNKLSYNVLIYQDFVHLPWCYHFLANLCRTLLCGFAVTLLCPRGVHQLLFLFSAFVCGQENHLGI